jgi:hypothetical protein
MSFGWKNNFIKNEFAFNFEQSYYEGNRFHAIYFIDSISGSLLVSKRYSGMNSGIIEKDEDLIGNFLNAINMFIQEIGNNKEEEIQEINFKETRILYEKKGRLLGIGITKKTDLKIERAILHQCLNDFYYRFENDIKHFRGYITPEILNYKNRLKFLNLNL